MIRAGKRLLKLGIVLSFVACFGISLIPSHPAAALSGSDFNAGHIIDDYVFTNASSMSVQEIQNFLNSKVTTCSTNHAGYTGGTGTVYNPPFVCLKGFYENPNSTYAVGFSYTATDGSSQTGSRTYYNNNAYKVTALCPVYGGYSGTPTCGSGDYHNGLDHLIPTLQTSGLSIPSGAESAAQIIYNAAQQYNINPQVLIVLLQKEQGLVTDDWPISYEYQAATGYGCPDTAPCSSNYAGFYNQIDSAAWQFRQYMDHPNNYNYVVGSNYIQYNPSPSCGGSNVNIQNQATAALYDYTPYQPNAAALSVVSDTSAGGSVPCGAYGNRNFWWYFTEWFGTTYTPSYSWQPVGQAVYTDSSKSTLLGWNATLITNQSAYVVVKAKNVGNTTWSNTGSNPIDLGTAQPSDRASPFCTSGWLACGGRPARMLESSVAPGETATFQFPITAPTKAGTYVEHFNLVAEGLTWLNDAGLSFTFTVQPRQFTWQPVGQAIYTDSSMSTSLGWGASLMGGDSAYAVITAKNTGNFTWSQSGSSAVSLGTDMKADRSSWFCTSSWHGCNRPALLQQASVAPGQTGTFAFPIVAPNVSGNYSEAFNLVGYQWFSDPGQHFDIKVTARTFLWQPVSQAVYTDSSKSTLLGWGATLAPNQTAYAVVTAKNVSNFTWTNSGPNPLDLGTSHGADRSSAFCTTGWLSCGNRPARLVQAAVAPGSTGTFEFPIKAPSSPGNYVEYFNLVDEGLSWFNDPGQSFTFNVH